LNDAVEAAWREWSLAVSLARKLRTLHRARVCDGEGFAHMRTNPKIDCPVQLDLALIECDRVASPQLTLDAKNVDGVILDEYGNVEEYQVLKGHPGGADFSVGYEHDVIPAQYMLHWFRMDRPEQHRGVPEIMPALELFGQLRRYTQAVLSAAETAADIAAILWTDAPADGEAEVVEPLDAIELQRNMMLTMPAGWRMDQMKAEHPPTTYPDFKQEVLKEIARCVAMPYNLAAGDSSKSNFASGRLDHQSYQRMISVTQFDMGQEIVNAIFSEWLAEARMAYGFDLPTSFEHVWFWDGPNYAINPLQEAKAQATRLKNHTTTFAREYARDGRDWQKEFRQCARELREMQKLGLPQPEPEKGLMAEASDAIEELMQEVEDALSK